MKIFHEYSRNTIQYVLLPFVISAKYYIYIFLFYGSFVSFSNFLSHPCFPRPFLACFCLSFLQSPFHPCTTLSFFPWLLSLLFLFCFFISHPSFQDLSSFLFISSPTLSLYYPLLSLTPFFPFLVHKNETFVGSYFKICTLFAFNMLKK